MKIRVFEVTQKLRYYPVAAHRGGRRQQKHKADESGKGLNAFVHSYRRIRATRGGMRDVCMSGVGTRGTSNSHSYSFRGARARLCNSARTHIHIGLSRDETSRFGASERNIIVSFENERVDCRNDLFALNMTRNSHELLNARCITFFKDLA